MTTQQWQPVRPDVARGVSAMTLLEQGVKLQVVRVASGGGFSSHVDGYGHLFYFLAGEGTIRSGER